MKWQEEGYTILELSVVLVIVMLVTGVVVVGVSNVRKADLSSSCAKISASIRYLYDLAVINNKGYKLVIDINEGKYWGEEASKGYCDDYLLPSEEERKFKGGAQLLEKKGSDIPSSVSVGSQNTGEPLIPEKKQNLLREVKLPKGISFSQVMTSHQDEPTEDGKAEIYIFPSGYVEKSFIYIKEDDEIFTVETIPLRGTAIVHKEKLDPRKILDTR